MKYRNKVLSYIAVVILVVTAILPLQILNVKAVSGVSVGATPTGNGGYTISVSSSYIGGVNVSTSDGGSAQFWCENGSCSLTSGSSKFTGNSKVSITASPINPMSNNNGDKVNVDAAGTSINLSPVSKPPTTNTPNPPTTQTPNNETPKNETPKKEEPKEDEKSKVSTLSSLSISEGTLSPAFKSGTMEYKVSLPATAKSLKVDAKASDAKGTVKGTGNHDLKVGDNTITVTGIAENGSTTVYTLKVYVDETPTAFAQFNDQKLGVVSNIEAVKAPTGFEKSKIKIDGKEVDAWTNNATKMTIVYLVNDKQEKDFYLYDEAKGVTSIYRPMALLGKNLILVDVPKDVQMKAGMSFTTVKVDNMDLPGWTFQEKAFENYVVIYMMDENGKMNYYQYEKTENRLQLYSGAAPITQETYDAYVKEQNAQQDKLMIVIYCLSGLSAVLLILAGVLFFRKKPNNKHQKIDVKEFDYGSSMHIEGNSMLDEEENE